MSDSATRVILVRHGQTALNAAGRLRGLADLDLDSVGIEQARATAHALGPLGIERVISSPLRRAVATARIIAEVNRVNHAVDPAFTDRDYGPWTGHIQAVVIEEWEGVSNAPGVEPEAGVLVRALQALETLPHGTDAASIVIVTHDAIIRPILASVQPGVTPLVATGSWAQITRSKDRWTITSIDNVP